MNRRGVIYDVGTLYAGGINTRPIFDPRVTRRELEIIQTDLHCNAVRFRGLDIGRLMTAAKEALQQGLEVWLSPEVFNKSQTATLEHLVKAATAAETLRQDFPEQLVLSVGSESTLFVQGIVAGRTITKRVANLFRDVKAGTHDQQPLGAFLVRAHEGVRRVFNGPLTYASLPFEAVDWSLFDFVGVDHYRDARIKDRYVQMLEPLSAHGKPVVVTEFGMRTYQGADSSGALGFGVMDDRSLFLHNLPLVGRFVRARLKKGLYVRDETLQARELSETLSLLDAAGVDGAFVASFDDPLATYSQNPRYDLDMSALSLVKTFADHHGSTYADMSWEPKEAFTAAANSYASKAAAPQLERAKKIASPATEGRAERHQM
jgi:hypothetical protein